MPYKLNPFTGEFDLTMGPGSGTAAIEFDADSGSAVPTPGGVINFIGATGITTSAAANAVQISLDTPVTVVNGGTGNMTFITSSILLGQGTNPITSVGPLSNGQLIIGFTGMDPVTANLTAGSNISISNGAGSITISADDAITWNDITGTSDTMVVDNGYISNNAALVTLTLPATCAVGDMIRVAGLGAGGWRISQNAGQLIHVGSAVSTTGATGHIDSTNRYDAIELLCVVTDTTFVTLSSVGNISIT